MDSTEELQEGDAVWPKHKVNSGRLNVADFNSPVKMQRPSHKKMSLPLKIPAYIPPNKIRRSWMLDFFYRDADENGGAACEMVPPHLIVANRTAGCCRETAFSVCTGNGRTLKGRDLQQVRNTILRKTGFLEG